MNTNTRRFKAAALALAVLGTFRVRPVKPPRPASSCASRASRTSASPAPAASSAGRVERGPQPAAMTNLDKITHCSPT